MGLRSLFSTLPGMYLRTTQRRNRDGSSVRYLQLAHNRWDPKAGRSSVHVLYHFGREDQLDRDAIRRLVSTLSRALEPGEAVARACHEARLQREHPSPQQPAL